MAPDLNAVSSDGRWDYSKPGSAGYDIPDITYDDPKNRRLKVLTIGAGFSGIMLAYEIQKYCENVEHVIYEKYERELYSFPVVLTRVQECRHWRYLARKSLPRLCL